MSAIAKISRGPATGATSASAAHADPPSRSPGPSGVESLRAIEAALEVAMTTVDVAVALYGDELREDVVEHLRPVRQAAAIGQRMVHRLRRDEDTARTIVARMRFDATNLQDWGHR